MSSMNSVNNAWASLCPPAQIYPIVMTGIILFNLYRGTYRYAMTHVISTIIGTILLWVLCAAKLEFAAYALILLPILFFVFLLAIVFYDQSLLQITHNYKPRNGNECEVEVECDTCSSCGNECESK